MGRNRDGRRGMAPFKTITRGGHALDRRDWLLLFLGAPGGPYPTDQIRVMKAMFLVSKEGPDDLRDLYSFEPYDYGPFDTTIYHDLDALEEAQLISSETLGTSRRIYRLTRKGVDRTAAIEGEAGGAALDFIRRTKRTVTSLSFLDLLRSVYEKYPDYAVRSKAQI